jgi:uncharacterized membrane protein
MYGSEFSGTSFWWIVPLVMMIFCFFMMRKRRGSLMCGFGSRDLGSYSSRGSDTAEEILDKRYASGAINKDEYEEIKKTIAGPTKDIKV